MRSANPGDPRHSPKRTQGVLFIADFCVFAKSHSNLAFLLSKYNFPVPNVHLPIILFQSRGLGTRAVDSADGILACTSMRTRQQVPSTYIRTKWMWEPAPTSQHPGDRNREPWTHTIAELIQSVSSRLERPCISK